MPVNLKRDSCVRTVYCEGQQLGECVCFMMSREYSTVSQMLSEPVGRWGGRR